MDREEQLDLLLDRWQQHQEEGCPVTPEELCREAPELLPSLRLRIDALARIEGLLGDSTPNTTSPVRERSARETVIVGVPSPPKAPPGYELHGELGRGGVGVVYKAKHLSLKRLVALKMLLTGTHASADDRRRFRREAVTIASLQHPNIVQIHEIGEYDGRAYLSLEYIDGGSLADRLREQPMPPRGAAELVRTLAAAVEAAHQASVVHRDLKPANVLLTVAGVPKISDFGLAKHLDDDRGRTGTGALMGTPAYMAPEQAAGIAGSVGPATDVYALGAILYECLTGQVPFRAASMMDLLDLVRHADPVAPTRLNARLPRDLETICLKCLHKNRVGRYASAAELADDLGRYLAGHPIQARPVGVVGRGVRWARRHRAMAALVASFALTALSLIAAGFWVSARLGAARVEREVSDARAAVAEAQVLADRERASAAERLVQTQRVYSLVTRTRERIARAEPGWRWRGLDDLAEAGRLPAAAQILELRAEAVACLGGIDVRPARAVLPNLPRAFSVACQPGGRRIAVGERAGGLLAKQCNVFLFDPDRPGDPLKLHFPQKVSYTAKGRPGPDIVRTVAFSPDGQRLTAGTRGGMLHVWNLQASPTLSSRLAHAAAIEKVLFSRDGRSIYTLDGSRLKRWDATNLIEAASAKAPSLCVAQHPTEGWLAVGGDHDKTQRLHPETLQSVGPPLDTSGRVFAFAPDGRTLLLARGRSVWAWDVAGNRLVQQLRAPDHEFAHEQGISDLAVSPDGTLLATASDHTWHVRVWDLVSGRLAADLPVGSGEGKVAFASDGRSVVMLAADRALIHEVGGREEQTIAARRPTPLQSFAMAGGAAACVSEGAAEGQGEIAFWPKLDSTAPPAKLVPFAPLSPTTAYPMALSADRRWVGVLGAGIPRLSLIDTRGESAPKPAEIPSDARSVSVAPDGRIWAAVGDEVRAWDVPSLDLVATWQNKLGIVLRGVSAIRAVSAGRNWVVTAGQDGVALVFPAGRGALTPTSSRELTRQSLRSVALSPDETLALVGSAKGERWLLRVPSADVVAELPACADSIDSLAWGPNDLVASGCRDGKVTLYRREGDRLRELFTARHPRSPRALALDGSRLAVLLEGERGVRVWHLDRVREKLRGLGLGDIHEPGTK